MFSLSSTSSALFATSTARSCSTTVTPDSSPTTLYPVLTVSPAIPTSVPISPTPLGSPQWGTMQQAKTGEEGRVRLVTKFSQVRRTVGEWLRLARFALRDKRKMVAREKMGG